MAEAVEQLLLFDFNAEQSPLTAIELTSEETGLNFLDKFNDIDITTEQRISESEVEYCKLQEKVYFESRDVLKKVVQELTSVYVKYQNQRSNDDEVNYLTTYSDIDVMKKRIKDVYERFVSRITYYFQNRYKVSLSSSDIKRKYDENSITYSVILDQIFEQLGGLTFKEKAVEELKTASRGTIYNKSKVKITKNKLSIIDGVWWSTSYDDSLSVGYDDKRVSPLFLALSHFENDSVERLSKLNVIYQELYRGSKEYDIFSKYEIEADKCESLRFYKNGKIEIVFADNTIAETFKNEYLL